MTGAGGRWGRFVGVAAALIAAYVTTGVAGCGADDVPPRTLPGAGDGSAAAGDGSTQTSPPGPTGTFEDVLRRLVAEGYVRGDGEWSATMTRAPLAKTDRITPQEGTSAYVPANDYWFAFVDLAPHAAFEHPVKFVFVDAVSGVVTVESQSWWPMLDGAGLAVSDKPLARIFSASTPRPKTPAPPAVAKKGAAPAAAWVVLTDAGSNTADARLLVPVGANEKIVNVLADLDGSGTWQPSEHVVKNFAVPAGATWAMSDTFAMPLDADRKFVDRTWVRVAASAAPVAADGWDGSCDGGDDGGCGDLRFDFSTWSGPDCDSSLPSVGCGAGLVGPLDLAPPAPVGVKGAACSYYCAPDGKQIATTCKALVINLGDSPGESWMEREMEKMWGFFEIRLGEGAATRLDRPTAAQALASIQSFMQGVKCLDQAHIYIIGHGSPEGGILAASGGGWLRPKQLHDAITAATHCGSPMDDNAGECRNGGYCDLNVSIMSCFAGNFAEGADSIALPGVNVLAAASATLVSWGTADGDTKGFDVGNAFRAAFSDDAADKAPNGNEDGVTTNAEAAAWAIANYDKGASALNDAGAAFFPYDSQPNYAEKADCNCVCSTPSANPFTAFAGALTVGATCDDADGTVTLGNLTATTFTITGLSDNTPITFTVTGPSTATATGVRQYGIGGHTVTFTISGSTINMSASSSQGSCATTLTK